MRGVVPVVRRLGIGAASAASVLLGLALVWRFLTRDSIQRAATGEMLAVLGLLVLPAAALAAVVVERRSWAAPGAAPGVEGDHWSPADPLAAAVTAFPGEPARGGRRRRVRRSHRRRRPATGAGSPASRRT
jgi:hypothetical protein